MNIAVRSVLVACIIVLSNNLYGMQEEKKNDQPQNESQLIIYALPGLGGRGSEEHYVRTLFEGYNYTLKNIVTPDEHSDLAQSKSVAYISNALKKHKEDHNQQTKILVHATSQAAAAKLKILENTEVDVDAVVLEGPFANANPAIAQSVRGARAGVYSIFRNLPYLEIVGPYLARLLKFPHYWPAGSQPIDSIPHIRKDLLMILVYGMKDQRVPPTHAPALYAGLRQHGNNNVYLICKEQGDHIHLLQQEDVPAFQAILRHHNILPAIKNNGEKNEDVNTIDITKFQPDFMQYIALYHSIHADQRVHEHIDTAWHATKILAGAAVTYWALKKLSERYRTKGFLADGAYILKTMQDSMPEPQFLLSNLLAQMDGNLG